MTVSEYLVNCLLNIKYTWEPFTLVNTILTSIYALLSGYLRFISKYLPVNIYDVYYLTIRIICENIMYITYVLVYIIIYMLTIIY